MSASSAMTVAEAEQELPPAEGPAPTPRYLREFVRKQFSNSMLQRLYDIATGDAQFSVAVAVPGMKDHPPHVEVVEVEAPAMVQMLAAKGLIDVAIPKQMGLVDGEDKGTGVILVPAMETRHAEDADYEIVEDEIGPDNDDRLEDRDVAPPPIEETVRPEFVQRVLAKRNGKNGKH